VRVFVGVILCFIGCLGSLSADQTNFSAASQAAPWLTLSSNARSSALGDASVALADGVNGAGFNPAGLSQLQGQEAAFQHRSYILDTSIEHVAYGLDIAPFFGLAASVDYINFGSVDKFSLDPSTNQLTSNGSFNPSAYHVDLGAGYALGSLSLGATAKFISESLDGSTAATAAAADLGALWRSPMGLNLGLALLNLGSQLEGADLPLSGRAGAAWKLDLGGDSQVLTLAADVNVPWADDSASTFGGGVEYSISLYALRAGYKVVGNGGAAGLTLGAGLRFKAFQIDYAYSAIGELGNSNQLSALVRL
jgi:hypothetical protein